MKGRTIEFIDPETQKSFKAIEIACQDGTFEYLAPLWVKTPPKSWKTTK